MPRSLLALLACLLPFPAPADTPPPVPFRNQQITGIGRRDPSDVIKVGGNYYVYYTKVLKGAPLYPSGYHGSVWAAVSEDAGKSWRELGEAIPTGSAGSFDSTSTFTPNILKWKERFYLYYTAGGDNFSNKLPRAEKMCRAAFTDDPKTQRDASPTLAKIKNPPDFLILHVATREASRVQSEALATALRKAGGKAEVLGIADKTRAIEHSKWTR